MPNQTSLIISGEKYSIQYPIQFISGDIASMRFDMDLTDLEIPWNEIFLQINDNSTPLIDSLFMIYQKIQKETISGTHSWTEFWAGIKEYNLKIEKSNTVLLNLLKIRDIKRNYLAIKNTLQNLHLTYDKLQILQEKQNYITSDQLDSLPHRTAWRSAAIPHRFSMNSSGVTLACRRMPRSVPIANSRCRGTTHPTAPSGVCFLSTTWLPR